MTAIAAVTVLAVTVMPAVASASSTPQASATSLHVTLGSSQVDNGLHCRVGDDNGTPDVVTHDGVSAWQAQPNKNAYIYCKITNAAFLTRHPMQISVKYWDGPSGSFDAQYNSTQSGYNGAWEHTPTVSLTGFGTWLTHTFTLEDAYFRGAENDGASFRIETQGSQPGVAVSAITVTQYDVPPAPAISEKQPGNVFLPGTTPSFGFTTTGTSVSYQAYNENNELEASGTAPATSGTGSITIPGLRVGYYTLLTETNQYGGQSAPAKQSFAVLAHPVPPAKAAADPFKYNMHMGQGEPDSIVGLMADAGMYGLRDWFANWAQIEKTKGQYNWSSIQAQMKKLKADGATGLFGDIGGAPAHNPLYPGTNVTNAATLQAWINVNIAFLKKFPQVKAIFVANEPNTHGFTAKQYVTILKPFYQQVKAAVPDVTIVGPSGPGVTTWTDQFIQLGGLSDIDAFALHPYQDPAPPEGLATRMTRLESYLTQHNGGKAVPIWITEFGWTTSGDAASRQLQASYYVRGNVLALKAGVKEMYWYSGPQLWEHFGLTEGQPHAPTGTPYGVFSPKPAYSAASTLTRELTGASYAGQLTVTPAATTQPVRGYRFTKAGRQVNVLWTTGAPQTVRIPAGGPVRITGIMGDTQTLLPFRHGAVTVTLTGNPVYVTGMRGTTVSTGASQFQVKAPASAAPGESVPVQLSARSGGRVTFRVNGKDYRVSPKAPVTVQVPASRIVGPQRVRAAVFTGSSHDEVAAIGATFEVKKPLNVTVDPNVTSVNPAGTALDVTVTNNQATAAVNVTGVQWAIGTTAHGAVTSGAAIAPDSSHTFAIKVSSVQLGTRYPVLANVDYGSQTLSYTGHLTFMPAAKDSLGTNWTTSALQSQPAISIPAQTPFEHTDKNTITPAVTGKLWWDYDSKYLYMTATLHQSVFYNPNQAVDSWSADDVQFAVSPAVADGTAQQNSVYTAFDVALTPDGPQIYRFESPLSIGLLTDAHLRVVRNNTAGTTTYYLALPWHDIAATTPSLGRIGVTWLTNVNLNDGHGRLGWFQWGSGFGFGRNPSKFNILQLMP